MPRNRLHNSRAEAPRQSRSDRPKWGLVRRHPRTPIPTHKLEGNCAVRPRILASTMYSLDMAFLVKPGGLRMAYLQFPSLLCSMDKVSQLKDPSYPEQQVLFLPIPEDWASVPRTHTIIQESQLHLSMGARGYPYPLDATKPSPTAPPCSLWS